MCFEYNDHISDLEPADVIMKSVNYQGRIVEK